MPPRDPGGPDVITRVLIREKQEVLREKRRGDRRTERCDALALKLEDGTRSH